MFVDARDNGGSGVTPLLSECVILRAHGPGGFASSGWSEALVQQSRGAAVIMPARVITRHALWVILLQYWLLLHSFSSI